jgi:hypothetical protein
LAVDANSLLYEIHVSEDHDPKDYFSKACDASIKERFVLRIDPNLCNHVSEKGYTIRTEEGNKYLKNFRSELKFSDIGPKIAGYQYLKIFPFKYGATFDKPTQLPPVVTDVEGHRFYDRAIPSDPSTWFKPDDYGATDLTENEDDDNDEDYFRSLTIPSDLLNKRTSSSITALPDQDTSNDTLTKKTKKSSK